MRLHVFAMAIFLLITNVGNAEDRQASDSSVRTEHTWLEKAVLKNPKDHHKVRALSDHYLENYELLNAVGEVSSDNEAALRYNEIGEVLAGEAAEISKSIEDPKVSFDVFESLYYTSGYYFNLALKYNDGLAVAYHNRGRYFLHAGYKQKSLEDFQSAIQLAPKSQATHFHLGRLYVSMGDSDKAIKAYEKAVELKPESVGARVNMAIIYRDNVNMQSRAHKILQEAVAIDPKDVFALKNLGIWYRKNDDPENALKYYQQAAAVEPDHSHLYFIIGNIYKDELKLYDKAIENYTKCLEIQPYYSWAYEARGRVNYKTKNWQAAIDDYEKFADMTNNRKKAAKAYYWAGTSYWNGLNDKKSARTSYANAAAQDPSLGKAQHYLAKLNLEFGHHLEAIEGYNQSIKLKYKVSESYNQRGWTYWLLGEKKLAKADFEKAVKADPSNQNAAYNLRRDFD